MYKYICRTFIYWKDSTEYGGHLGDISMSMLDSEICHR